MTPPPVSFAEKASAAKSGAGGYPIQISAKDLDANFAYATLEISDTSPQGDAQPFSVDEFTGPGGHTQRRLLFNPPPPQDSDAVFGMSGGALTWLKKDEKEFYVVINGALKLCKFFASEPYDPPA